MGYDLTLFLVEKTRYPSRELALSSTPYKDGSGFEPLRNPDGSCQYTGRTEYCCKVIGVVELCGVGGETGLLNSLTAPDKAQLETEFCMFFAPGGDGNTSISVDRYGDPIRERPVQAVLEALERDYAVTKYRRLPPAIALLKSVLAEWDSPEDLRVLFYGH